MPLLIWCFATMFCCFVEMNVHVLVFLFNADLQTVGISFQRFGVSFIFSLLDCHHQWFCLVFVVCYVMVFVSYSIVVLCFHAWVLSSLIWCFGVLLQMFLFCWNSCLCFGVFRYQSTAISSFHFLVFWCSLQSWCFACIRSSIFVGNCMVRNFPSDFLKSRTHEWWHLFSNPWFSFSIQFFVFDLHLNFV